MKISENAVQPGSYLLLQLVLYLFFLKISAILKFKGGESLGRYIVFMTSLFEAVDFLMRVVWRF